MTAKKKEPWRIVPLCKYSNPRERASYGPIPAETKTVRMNGMYGKFAYTNGSCKRLIDAKFMWDYWYNFCGGLFFFSPQVSSHGVSAWEGAGSTNFINFPNLNTIFEEQSITDHEVEEIMWCSLGAGLISLGLELNKRWLVGADRTGGRLSKLVQYALKASEKPVYRSSFDVVGGYVGMPIPTDSAARAAHERMWANHVNGPRHVDSMKVTADEAINVNWNSGAECKVVTLKLGMGNNDPNPAYREPRSLAPIETIDHIRSRVQTLDYLSQIPNYQWAN